MNREEYLDLCIATHIAIAEVNEGHVDHWYMQDFRKQSKQLAKYHRKRAKEIIEEREKCRHK